MKKSNTNGHEWTRISAITFVFICVYSCFLPFSAQAQDYKNKLWTLPSCAVPEMHLMFSDKYLLSLDGVSAHIEQVKETEIIGKYFVVEGAMESMILRVDGDALYRYFTLTPDIEGVDLDNQQNGYRSDYVACDVPRIGGVADRAPWENIFKKLDSIISYDTAFAALDTDMNARLDRAELENAARDIVWITGAASCDFAAASGFDVKDRAQKSAGEILSLADTDKDGAVSLHEIKARWPVLESADITGPLLREAKTLYTIFPFLPESAPHYTCVSCSTAAPCGAGADAASCGM